MNHRILNYVLIVSIAGFLMGFDTVVISGVNLPVKNMWQTSDWIHGTFIISMTLWGMVVGALTGGYPTEKLGRKQTLILVGLLFVFSALGAASSSNPYSFSFFRFIGGLGAGFASIAAPTYISEISEAHNRGRLVMLYQFNIVFGILLAYLSNYLLEGLPFENTWRLMIGVEVLPASLFVSLLFCIPKSPRWFVNLKNKTDLIDQSDRSGLFSGKYNRALLLSFLMAFFNQFSGISFILFYAPEIFEKAGLGTSESLLSSISLGIINLIFTFAGIYLIDRKGRKQLMYLGTIGYIISLSMVAIGFYMSFQTIYMVIFVLLFIASHAIGQGAVIWVFIPEIFPNSVRPFGQAWGAGLLNIFAATIALLGAVIINSFPAWFVFSLFTFFMVLQLIFVRYMMPETKGIPLEEIEYFMRKQKN
ncbi:MFS transporter [Gaoshiqia sp. Z1-71]|uniref:MFS transporter n=1 Tax=Gaoshiqia hydrogeniformans TaxID=3290090 RepID=UPI003BF7C23A